MFNLYAILIILYFRVPGNIHNYTKYKYELSNHTHKRMMIENALMAYLYNYIFAKLIV